MEWGKLLVYHRKKIALLCVLFLTALLFLLGRYCYLIAVKGEHYSAMAEELHERERPIKAKRGRILDRNGRVLADNRSVCTISVIHSQIVDAEQVIDFLSQTLGLSPEFVRKRVEKRSSMERVKSNVDKAIGDLIREANLPGVKVDEDYKRTYTEDYFAGKVLGFTGGDNQGIIGLEVSYDEYLQGTPGIIYATTDAKGLEIEGKGERRKEPVDGADLYTSLDANIQGYALLLAEKVMEEKQAQNVSILVMNPKNGEIYAMVDVPEFNSNEPFVFPEGVDTFAMTEKEKMDALNDMWRNRLVSDTYEPGSTFKIITATIGLENHVVTTSDPFYCPGYIIVDDRRIRCHKVRGHGAQTFVQAIENSCNPSFVTLGLRIGVDRYYEYFERLGLKRKTGIDLPGEAGTIMHQKENMGNVELATVSFGQSFQLTPIQLLTTVSSIINGGTRITPHLGVKAGYEGGEEVVFTYPEQSGMISQETSETMRFLLEKVVSEGGGGNGKVEGFLVGGKTATSQKLPRGSGKYIASFIGFAPADDPQVIAIVIINEPQGMYYGGQIAAPVIRQLYENILPYLEIQGYNE